MAGSTGSSAACAAASVTALTDVDDFMTPLISCARPGLLWLLRGAQTCWRDLLCVRQNAEPSMESGLPTGRDEAHTTP
jgi:hypothetical protein